jgi:hypothetical protein
MNKYFLYFIKTIRKINQKLLPKAEQKPICEQNPDKAAQIIYDVLISDEPCMIARFGAFELSITVNYLGVKKNKINYINFIKGNEPDWQWNQSLIQYMHTNAGFFPPTIDKIEQFCKLMIQEIPQIDVLGSWLPNEVYFEKELKQANKINLELLNPYFSSFSWTQALEGKNVLVIHPFAKTIEDQYKKRELLFKNNILPKFNLTTIAAVQSIAGEKTIYNDWFEALDYMKIEIDKVDYDICLIGAGAYGLPLAAHVKKTGKKAVHMGGSLQLLFGIKGKRWEDPNYNPTYNFSKLMNEHWVYPDKKSKPKNAKTIEDGCYW